MNMDEFRSIPLEDLIGAYVDLCQAVRAEEERESEYKARINWLQVGCDEMLKYNTRFFWHLTMSFIRVCVYVKTYGIKILLASNLLASLPEHSYQEE